jgi:hypothetical protein
LLAAQRAGGHHHDFDLLKITALLSAADNFNQKARPVLSAWFFSFFRPLVRSGKNRAVSGELSVANPGRALENQHSFEGS